MPGERSWGGRNLKREAVGGTAEVPPQTNKSPLPSFPPVLYFSSPTSAMPHRDRKSGKAEVFE